MVREFGDLPAAQRRRSSFIESRVIDAVLDVIPTAELRMDDIAAKIRPILQSAAVQASPVQQSDTLCSLGLKRSMQFLTKQLDERTEELSSVRVELSTKKADLVDVTAERDKCMAALEEAHECVSVYHRKLGAMERTVGQALVSKGEIKELTAKLEEAKSLNTQYKEALTTAEMRIESLQDSNTSQQQKVHGLEDDLQTWKTKAERTSHDATESSRRVQELDGLVSELKTRLADAESQKNTFSEQISELEARHNETLAALSDMITIQKRSDAEREEMAENLQTQQRGITQQEATIEALRSQLEVAHHQPLCASADAACADTRFLDGDRSTCMRALDRAASALEVSLPTLYNGLQQLANHPSTPLGSAAALRRDGTCSPSPERTPMKSGASASLGDKKMQNLNVEDIIKELQKLHDIIHAACMFNNQEDDYKHTLYKSLRDLWGSLEQRLSNILPPLATVTQAACEGVSEAHRRECNLREALQDTHDALGRTATDRQRTKDQLAELQEQLTEEKQKASDEAREAAVQAQTETMKHATDNQRLTVRAEAAEAEASRSQQECQRLHAEYDHKVHALEAGMRARFAALRDSYQQQLDTLHMQIIEIDNHPVANPKPSPEVAPNPFTQQIQRIHPTNCRDSHTAAAAAAQNRVGDQAPHVKDPLDTFCASSASSAARQAAAPSSMHRVHAYVPSTHSDSVGSYAGELSLQEEHQTRNRAQSEAAPCMHTVPNTATPEPPYGSQSQPPHGGWEHGAPHVASSSRLPRPIASSSQHSERSEPSLRDNVPPLSNASTLHHHSAGGAAGTSASAYVYGATQATSSSHGQNVPEHSTATQGGYQGLDAGRDCTTTTTLGGYQGHQPLDPNTETNWPVLDAPPPPPFSEPRSASGSLSGVGVKGGFQWGIQVPTDPGDAPSYDSGPTSAPRDSFSFTANLIGIRSTTPATAEHDLPDDPLPNTNHLNGPSAPPHVLSRQAQTYGTAVPHPHGGGGGGPQPPFPHSTHPPSARSRSPHSHPFGRQPTTHHSHDAQYHSRGLNAAYGAGFRPEHSSHSAPRQAAWMQPGMHGAHAHAGWPEAPRAQQPGRRGGVEGRSRPQSAQPGGFNREGPPATAEAVYLASQHAGMEGAVRPQSAQPSDHWTIRTRSVTPGNGGAQMHASPSPAKCAAGRLQPHTQHMPRMHSPNVRSTPTPRSQRGSSSRANPPGAKGGKSPRASKPPAPSPASVTEDAVMSALQKAGVLDRLAATTSSSRRTSATGKAKTTRTSSTGRGRSRTPKQSNWLL